MYKTRLYFSPSFVFRALLAQQLSHCLYRPTEVLRATSLRTL